MSTNTNQSFIIVAEGLTVHSFVLNAELWSGRIRESCISPILFQQKIPPWFTQRMTSHGSDVGLTTSCTETAPFQSTGKQ